ncbi:MAG: peptidoglycan-binding protein [Minisyncoccia bacterium]
MIASTNAVAKIAAVVAGLGLVAMSFASFAPAARAATTAELEAQVQALLAQIAALGGSSSSSSTTFTMDLTLGSSGAEVTALQNWLIAEGYSIPAGATGYFGAQTQAALAAFQAANGISPASGYFGPITRAKVNGMGGGSMGGDDDDSNADLGGGEASLEDLSANDGEDDEVELGASAKVAEFEFDVEDADIEINRLDLAFDSTGVGTGDDTEPWDVFNDVTIYLDGEEVASEDVSEEDDWLDDDGTGGKYVYRFSGLDAVVDEGETGLIEVEVEADGGADLGTNDLALWELYIDTDGIRGTDGEGIEQYLGDTGAASNDGTEDVTFDVVEEGADDELSVQASSEDPDAATLEVDTDSSSDWFTVFVFELEADEDGGDIELETIPVDWTVAAGEEVDNIINDAKLVIDGEEFDDFVFTGAADTFGSTTFDIDGDFVIGSGETVTVEAMLEFTGTVSGAYDSGDTIAGSIDGPQIAGDGADSLTATGSATGDTHELRTTGLSFSVVDDSAVTTVVDGADNDYATFVVEVEVEAFDANQFISQTPVTAYTFQIENASDGSILGSSTATSTIISSTADTEGSAYRINEGETETFTFTMTLNPKPEYEGISYRAQLLTIVYGQSSGTPTGTTYTVTPTSDYETNGVLIND